MLSTGDHVYATDFTQPPPRRLVPRSSQTPRATLIGPLPAFAQSPLEYSDGLLRLSLQSSLSAPSVLSPGGQPMHSVLSFPRIPTWGCHSPAATLTLSVPLMSQGGQWTVAASLSQL